MLRLRSYLLISGEPVRRESFTVHEFALPTIARWEAMGRRDSNRAKSGLAITTIQESTAWKYSTRDSSSIGIRGTPTPTS